MILCKRCLWMDPEQKTTKLTLSKKQLKAYQLQQLGTYHRLFILQSLFNNR